MNEREKKELAVSKIVLLVLAFIGILAVIWLAWIHPSSKNKTDSSAVTSFATCIKAGNPVQDSYPETCVAKDGKHFTNPGQNIQRLAIKEWNTDVLVNGVRDAYYTYDEAAKTITLSTKTLDKRLNSIQGCASGLHEVMYERLQPGDPKAEGGTWTVGDLQAEAKHVGNYYYRTVQQIETACAPAADEPAVKEAKLIHDQLAAATFSPKQ
jgi:hypothetical protein